MRGEVVARNYASALFDLALRNGQVEACGEGLDVVASLLDELPEFRTFLETPGIDRQEKKRVLREAFEGRVPDPVLNFVLLVVDRRRQRLLREMDRQYRGLMDAHLGRVRVEVTVSRPLDEGELAGIRDRIAKVLGKEVVPHLRVRPEILGGIVFRSGDVVYDGSVRRRLDQMRRRLMAADVQG